MAIVTPSSLHYVVSASVASRIVIFVISYISNIIIKDHRADAYRGKYHLALARNGTADLPRAYQAIYNLVQGFTKWDAQYFLDISRDGYISEQHLAFLPLFPVAIAFTRQLIFERGHLNVNYIFPDTQLTLHEDITSTNDLASYIRSVLIGVALNNFIFFPFAAVSLYALTRLVKGGDESYARNVVWWFCFNPASVFFSTCYTESLFAALTFFAMFIIEYKAERYRTSHRPDNADRKKTADKFVPLEQLNRLLSVSIPSLAFIALSTATRSNGLATIGLIGFQFLLKYAPLSQLDRTGWTVLMYVSVILELLQDVLVVVMSSIIAASGYITFQLYSYLKFCADRGPNQRDKGALNIKPDWCNNPIPHPYSNVQAKYWNVGLFQYYQLKQLPNFLLAFPMTYIVLVGSLKRAKSIANTQRNTNQLVYYLQGILLTIFCGISINVQVTTRLLASSCPIVYWIAADMAMESRLRKKALTAYFMTYYILGTILHVNFYPWT